MSEKNMFDNKIAQDLFESSNVGIIISTLNGKIINANSTALQITEYQSDNLLKVSLDDLFDNQNDRQKFYELLKLKGKISNFEIQLSTKNKNLKWINISSTTIKIENKEQIITNMIDISDNYKIKSQLNRVLQSYRKCIYSVLHTKTEKKLMKEICDILIDTANYYMVWIGLAENDEKKTVLPIVFSGKENNYLENITIRWDNSEFGMGPTGTAIKTKQTQIALDYDSNPKYKPWKDLAKKRGYNASISIPIMIEENQIMTLNIYSKHQSPFDEEEILLLEDIAKHLSFGIKSLRSNQLLEIFQQSKNMEAIGRMARGLAHDFNNIFTALSLSIELMESNIALNTPLAEDLEELKNGLQMATSINKQILAFSKKEASEYDRFNPSDVLKNLLSWFLRSIGKTAEIKLNLPEKISLIRGDKSKFEQIAINLILNSKDAMSKFGKIEISFGEIYIDEYFNVCNDKSIRINDNLGKFYIPGKYRPGKYLQFQVKDTGSGIPDDVLPYLFEPYFTSKESGKGTGLGLANVYSIVRDWNGFISVKTKLNEGTDFNIFLPLFPNDQG